MINLPHPHPQWPELHRKARQIPRVCTSSGILYAAEDAAPLPGGILAELKMLTHNAD